MSSAPHTPTWQFRSPYRRATDAPTAAAAVDMVSGMEHGYDRSRMLLAIARRPDLTAKVLDRMLNDRSIGHDSQWANALLHANPRLAATKPGRSLINRDLMYVLVSNPHGFERQVVEYIAGMFIGDPSAAEYATALRASIGVDRVRDLAHEYARQDASTLRTIASSVLMDDDLWDVALDTLPRTKKATRERGMEVSDLVTTLSRRPDLTTERVERLLAAMHPRMRRFMVMDLFRNRACPASAFIAAATSKDQDTVDAALSEPHCPDDARFAAVLAGRTYVLGAVRSPIPDNVAEAALAALTGAADATADTDDDDALDPDDLYGIYRASRNRTVEDRSVGAHATTILSMLTRLSGSTHVLNACYDLYLAQHATKGAAVVAFANDLLQRHSTHVHGWDERDRLDTAGEFLAGHLDPDLRRVAVLYMHPDDLADAASDPDPKVRTAVASRTDVPVPLLMTMAADPHQRVRLAVAEHTNAPAATLTGLASDPSVKVRVAVARHDRLLQETMAHLGGDSSVQVRAIISDRFLGALAAEPVPADA